MNHVPGTPVTGVSRLCCWVRGSTNLMHLLNKFSLKREYVAEEHTDMLHLTVGTRPNCWNGSDMTVSGYV